MPTPLPPSSAERQYHVNGRAAVVATRERGSSTPRKERQGQRESSALQDPGLKDYRLGECLGKGAFGSVYKAFNWGTGEAVAVKQIKLADLPKSELRMIESEIDLLKNLHHDNIVKYLGLFVAPIESDLKSKSSEKANGLRPTRSSIRHSRRPDVARAVRRRAAILRETFTNTSFEQPERSLLSREWEDAGHPAASDRPARYPWIETGQLPPPEAYNPPSAPPPLPEWLTYRLERHDAAAERTRANDDEDRIMSLLGDRYLIASRSTSGSPSPAGEQPSQLVRLRARNLRRGADDAPNPETYRRERIAPSVAARFDRSPEREQSGSTAIDNASRPQQAPGQFIREAQTSVNRRAWRRLRSSVAVDGLGDRTRSMSPEVWDTLLTTLTPDPQPPSAGSSFASASASSSAAISQRRSAAASSRTSFTDPEPSHENAERQVDAAVGGIIPLLMRIMQTDRPPKEFALPILCDMAHSGSKGRRYLWQNKGLDFYVSLLADQYWQVTALDAIFVWLQEETAKVESHLLDGKFTNAIVACFDTNKINTFDSNLLEPLLKLLRLSPAICGSLAKPEMFAGIGQRLGHKKAVVRLNLLRLVRNIMDTCEMDAMGTGNGSSSLNSRQVQSLVGAIQTLADKDSAVLVRNLASELVRSHVEGDTYEGIPPERKGSAGSIASRRSGSGLRRTSSYTPPGLHSAVSMPPTPTSSSHSRHRTSHHPSLSGNAYIEVAASPRRTPVTGTQERESILYRPRSRDGATAIPRRERLGGVSACFDTGTRVQQLSWQEAQQGSQL
ncbi:hypothetical protein BN1723_013526 [Verticillium longisporum]|uniref:non-specific serine/threonine protein kinase n=1 Tax=Verticillium longisporum TaxID=100787 RepID=A0A0G4LSX0_VERLO|nr:hypothetical protein BN1723_013526 [Verticillium longisporum]